MKAMDAEKNCCCIEENEMGILSYTGVVACYTLVANTTTSIAEPMDAYRRAAMQGRCTILVSQRGSQYSGRTHAMTQMRLHGSEEWSLMPSMSWEDPVSKGFAKGLILDA